MSQLIEHTGTITSIAGGEVEVLIMQTSACSSCSARMACATSDMQQKKIMATTTEQMSVGDKVVVYGEQRIGFRAVMLAFVLPLLLMFAALALGLQFIEHEGIAALLALLCLAPYYAALAFNRDKIARQLRFSARKIIE